MTTVRIVWKKLVHAAAWIADAIIASLAAAFTLPRLIHPRWHKQGRHAAPRPPKARDEDAKTIAWLARLHEVPARVMRVPLMRDQIHAAVLRKLAVESQAAGDWDATRARPEPGVPWADVDTYLTDDALRHGFNFEATHPVLGGELKPPVFEPTLPPLPEPMQQWKPHVIPDVPLNVPGPAESASPVPPSGSAEAATPDAVASAGPGTPPDPEATGQIPRWTDWCLTAPLDQVKAASHDVPA